MTIFFDKSPMTSLQPASVQELGELIRGQAGAIYPVGGGTELGLGHVPTKPGIAIDMTGLSEVIDFPARDMTITVQAGVRIDALQKLIATEHLRLPIDVPSADKATLGGIIATNTSGARRFGYGTLRDYVIGISAVNDQGSEFKAGGRVVKNVAGYDICKLLVGSLGTLGIISQVTLKLRPLVEQEELLLIPTSSVQLESSIQKLLTSRTRPIVLDVIDSAASRDMGLSLSSDYGLIVGYDGNREAVAWQVEQLRKEFAETAHERVEPAVWQKLADWNHQPAIASVKVSLLPSGLVEFIRAVRDLPGKPMVRAHAGNGIVHAHFTQEMGAKAFAEVIASWRALAGRAQGHVVVTRCPPEWKTVVSVWGPPPKDVFLMRQVKKQFDPGNLFNPGRFVDGI